MIVFLALFLLISHSGNIADRLAYLADSGPLGDADLSLMHDSDEPLTTEEFDQNAPFAGLLGDPLLESEVFFAPQVVRWVPPSGEATNRTQLRVQIYEKH